MSDLIDRQAAIDALKQQAETMSDWSNRYAEQRKGVLTAVNIVEDLPPAQPTPDQNGDLWIIVPDIDEVTRIYVQEGKSKFCRIFYEEQEQPEPYVGHWIPVGGALYQCDQCGVVSLKRKFCSECGADMREVTE